MSVAVCILAKDEGRVIGEFLQRLLKQSLLRSSEEPIAIHVVANGCTDDTVEVSNQNAAIVEAAGVGLRVHDLPQGGKSRAWNRFVHDLVGSETDTIVFVDADIEFVDSEVLSRLVATLRADPSTLICSGRPVKDISRKADKSLLDRFSIMMSARTGHRGVVNGSLYASTLEVLREIWLPNDTPGEDGFLNAMITTRGFTEEPRAERVAMMNEPTHYFEAHKLGDFVNHERRLLVATVINRWIFEHLWSLKLTTPAGPLIGGWNTAEPEWVERIIRERTGNQTWIIPNALIFGRLQENAKRSFLKRAAFFPLAIAATLATLPPAIIANRQLKRSGAGKTW